MKKWWDEITNGGPDNTKFSIVVLRGSQKSWWDEIGVLFYLCLITAEFDCPEVVNRANSLSGAPLSVSGDHCSIKSGHTIKGQKSVMRKG